MPEANPDNWTGAAVTGQDICHVTTVHAAYDARIFHRECRALARAGYNVHLIQACDRDDVVDDVKVHALPIPGSRLKRVLVWPWLAYKKIRSLRPQPLICHFHDPELLLVAKLLQFQGYEVVYDIHENVADQILQKKYLPRIGRHVVSYFYRILEHLLVRRMATVHVLDTIARRYREPKVVVRNLPPYRIPPENRERIREASRPVIVYVGAVTQERGAIRMVELAAELKRRGLDFEMRIIGPVLEAGLAERMSAMVEKHGIADQVTMAGRVPFTEGQRAVEQADIGLCLLDSLPNYCNSLPTKIFEYMSYGVPVVTSDIDAWRDYVEGTNAGFQVEAGNLQAVADVVEDLLGDGEKRAAMGRNGRNAVETQYCWEHEEVKLLRFYQMLIGTVERPAR